jgi:hypothetical protein
VRLLMADTALVPDDGITAGSRTTPSTVPSIRRACAAARNLLIGLAAEKWQVDRDKIAISDGVASEKSGSDRKLTYADLATAEQSAQALKSNVPGEIAVTSAHQWKVLGVPLARPNRRDIVTGAHAYPSDVIRPGMLYGKILRAPTYRTKLVDVDLAPAKQIEGAVVVCDGGDFVSYAGKYIDSYGPGCWLDAGPYGCLGTGMGYAMAARVARPDKQIVVMLGDGAAGFSLMDADSLVRHDLPVVIVVGNNGIWGLEKHPMQALYGYDVAADLNQEARYDEILKALGGAGETIEKAAELPDAFDRAVNSGVPYLLNVLTDPADAYPRSSNLA